MCPRFAPTSTNGLLIFSLYPRKGEVRVGADAGLVVWDPSASRTFSSRTRHQNVDFGRSATGVATHTLSCGLLAWVDGDLRAVRGHGQDLIRPTHAAYFEANRLRAG